MPPLIMIHQNRDSVSDVNKPVPRNAISHSQRLALVEHYHTSTPRASHAALQAWFYTQYGRNISQSIVSRSLKNEISKQAEGFVASGYRLRGSQWPWLELLLDEWIRDYQGQHEPSIEVVAEKARQFWRQSDSSDLSSMPQFSAGWVAKYRKRHAARKRRVAAKENLSTSPAKALVVIAPEALWTALTTASDRTSYEACFRHTKMTFLSDANCKQCQTESWRRMSSISADHLIHLIQHNTFRALVSNKDILSRFTFMSSGNVDIVTIRQTPTQLCGGLTTVHATNDGQPPLALLSTLLQQSIAHISFLNTFPCPQMRDNMIKRGENFIPEDLCSDVFCDFLKVYGHTSVVRSVDAHNIVEVSLAAILERQAVRVAEAKVTGEDVDDYAAGQSGMISWGDSWVIENWEITPKLFKKWSWVFEGCDELLRATNRWRTSRHEEPLTFGVQFAI